MDRNHFDAFARILGTAGSRRALVGGLMGAAVLGTGLELEAVAKSKKQRRRSKKKKKSAATFCFGTTTCDFSGAGGQDLAECTFAGTTLFKDANCGGCSLRAADFAGADLDGAQLGGASLRDANLNGATLVGADLRGASLRGACLTDADLTGALTDGGTLEGAFICRTTLPSGQVGNDDCAVIDDCCSFCIPTGGACGGIVVATCCTGTTCIAGFCAV